MFSSSFSKGFGLGHVCLVVAILAIVTFATQL